jgi:peptidoglycan hydrolase-like protein with peptidoglycan-binding domain
VIQLALPIVLSAALAGMLAASAPAPSSTATKAPARSAGKKSSGAQRKAAAKRPAARASASSKKSGKKPVQSWRTGQQQPAPERYRGIQEALIGRGYLEGPATGEWGPQSVEALKKFQLEQNLKGDGKLDSLSLIALGLGPKRNANPQTRAQP